LEHDWWRSKLEWGMDLSGTAARLAKIKLQVSVCPHPGPCFVTTFTLYQGRTTGRPRRKSHTYSFCRGRLTAVYTVSIQKQFIEALECCFWDHQLAMAYHSQLTAKT
jgi:hypothetical protein